MIDIRAAWQESSTSFAKALLAGIGFSFHYAGNILGPKRCDGWRISQTEGAYSSALNVVLTHDSGLVVTRRMRVLPDFSAVEYQLHIKNTATQSLAAVSAINALDLSFGAPVVRSCSVVSSGGGMADGFLPPRSFAIRNSCFAPTVPDEATVELTTEGGWSSNRDLPFFFVHNEVLQEGLFVALGWSGQWKAAIRSDPAAGVLTLTGKIPDLNIALEPGEEITGPTILVGLYTGSLANGSNQLRRLIRDVYTPKLSGGRFLPIALYDHFWNIGVDFDEALLKELANAAAAIGQEYFLLDAGWYAGTGKGYEFSSGVGNWYEIDRVKLPNGLMPIADHVCSRGLKFGLWFEPERVAPGSQLARAHPEWVLWKHEKEPESLHRELNQHHGLLDYGRPEVQRWVKDLLDRYIRDYGVEYVRYDFNIAPLPYWEAHDEPHRRGITQLKHIQGFYSIVDWIRERHPDVVLEGCASGGRRIDLETARRFHTFLISDYTVDPSIVRYHLFGINHFLPGNYHYVQYTLPFGMSLTPEFPGPDEFEPDDLGFQSLFGGAFGTGGRIHQWPESMKRQARRHVEIWKSLRRYLVEDYHALSAQPADLQCWSGWQFHDRQDQSGFVQTFRTRTSSAACRFLIKGLDAFARYRFTDPYSAESFDVKGVHAMDEGIEVTQAPMSSRVWVYAKTPNQ